MQRIYKVLLLLQILFLSSCSIFLTPPREFPATKTLTFANAPIELPGLSGTILQNVAYGPYTDNVFDIYMPNSDQPTALVIYIHGGGFIQGDKDGIYRSDNGEGTNYPEYLRGLLKNNVAVASINYRMLQRHDTLGVIKSLTDSKRCLQYIRYHAAQFNIDKTSIALCGNSAGAGTCFWIALQNDMADAQSKDPVLRESTRVKGVAVIATQSTYNLERWGPEIFAEYDPKKRPAQKAFVKNPIVRIYLKRMLLSFDAISSKRELHTPACDAYCAKLDFLNFFSPDDPEIWIENLSVPYRRPKGFNEMFHHSNHAKALKIAADKNGVKCIAYYHNYADPSGEDFVAFLTRKVQE